MTSSAGESGCIRTLREAIDESIRPVCLGYFLSAGAWLLIGGLLALAGSAQLHLPDRTPSLGGALTYGRAWPAGLHALAYGWFSLSALGFTIWAMSRLSKRPGRYLSLSTVSLGLWNVGLTGGVGGILLGYGTGAPWMEFAYPIALILTLAMALNAAWALLTMFRGNEPNLYISQWLTAIALLIFPTVYFGANTLALKTGVPGLTSIAVQNWYVQNAFGLWVAPLSLAALFYVIPKAVNRSAAMYSLGFLGVWCFLLGFNLTGPFHLLQQTLPSNLVVVTTIARMLTVFGVLAIFASLLATVLSDGSFRYNPVARCGLLATLAFPVAVLFAGAETTRTASIVVRFTEYGTGQAFLALFGFGSMATLAAIYMIVPKLTNREWPSAFPMHGAIGGLFGGAGLIWLTQTMRGIAHGIELNDPSVSMATMLQHAAPFHWAVTIGLAAIVVGGLAITGPTLQLATGAGRAASAPAMLADPNASRRGRTNKENYLFRVTGILYLALLGIGAVGMYLRGLGSAPLALILIAFVSVYVFYLAWYMMYLKFEGRWVFAMLTPTCVIAALLVLALGPDMIRPYAIDPNPTPTQSVIVNVDGSR